MISGPVVVGAGPAGLAVAATLARQGQECAVLEGAESVGASWQGRYDSLRLHTVRWLSGLPSAATERHRPSWSPPGTAASRTPPSGGVERASRAQSCTPSTTASLRPTAVATYS